MGAFSKFASVLTALGKGAKNHGPAIATFIGFVNPVAGAALGAILSAIAKAEADHGPGSGKLKQEQAFSEAAPAVLAKAEDVFGKEFIDHERLKAAIAKLMEGYVELSDSLKPTPRMVKALPEAPAV